MEAKTKGFEETFNDWYKQFLAEERKMNEKIIIAKKNKQKEIEKAREDAKRTIREYELEQQNKLDANKAKLDTEKNFFEKMDKEFKKDVEDMKEKLKKNKDKVIDMLINRILTVDLEIPDNINKFKGFDGVEEQKEEEKKEEKNEEIKQKKNKNKSKKKK